MKDIKCNNLVRSNTRKAFTMIELLAVVTILSIVTVIGTVNLAAMHDHAGLERIGFQWRSMDAEARLLARLNDSTVLLKIAGRSDRIELHKTNKQRGSSDYRISEINTAPFVVNFLVPESVRTIDFDRRGCSRNYMIDVSSATRTKRWSVSGLTGWIEKVKDEEFLR